MRYTIKDVWKIRQVPPPLVAEPLKAKAAELRVDVYDLTPEQTAEAMKGIKVKEATKEAKVSSASEPVVEVKRSRKAAR